MIDYETYMKIKTCHEKDGLNCNQISSITGLSFKTVSSWLAEERYRMRRSKDKSSKLDPFKNQILQMLEKYPYSAAQVFLRIKDNGFDGGYTIVKDYVRKMRPSKTKAYLKLSFAPGECGQADWGSFGSVKVGSTSRRLSFFVMVLCYSRMMYLEFTVSQTMEHFLNCHKNAFEFFGHVPKKIMIDNLKSAVLSRIIGQAPVFNPRYFDFAKHYGFDIMPCNVRAGNEKGRVENAVGYIKKNFLNGLDIPDFSSLHPAARLWLDSVANVRIHGETRQKPVDLFEKERPYLNPLPLNPFDVATVYQARASSQFRITYDANHYSVPAELAGERLTLKAYPDRLCIYKDDKLIARHPRCYDRYQDFEDPDHPKALLAQRRKAKDQKIYMRFLSLSPKAEQYCMMLMQRRLNPNHHIRKIVALSEIYHPDAVARAIEDALHFQAFSSEYVANILESRARLLPEPGALHLTRNEDLLDIDIQKPDLSVYERSDHEDKD
jgi:transposase